MDLGGIFFHQAGNQVYIVMFYLNAFIAPMNNLYGTLLHASLSLLVLFLL